MAQGPIRRNRGWDNVKPGSNGAKNIVYAHEARARETKEEELTRDRVLEDPSAALEEVLATFTVATKRLTERWLRQRGEPSRIVVEAVSEFRRAVRDILEYQQARGALAEAEDFLAGLSARVEALAPGLDQSASPIVEAPA